MVNEVEPDDDSDASYRVLWTDGQRSVFGLKFGSAHLPTTFLAIPIHSKLLL